jgi:ribokinase
MKRIDVHIVDGKCGYTVALEYEEEGRHVNVMLSDTGDLRDFDGSKIAQWDAIADSKIVAVLNWAANGSGNKLCERVFSFAHERNTKTFFDPADVSEVTDRLPEFKSKILDSQLANILSLNDNETRSLCKSLCSYTLPESYSEADLRIAAVKISDISGATVDIHTRNFSVSCENGKNCTTVPCHKVEQIIVTGAGDVWDSADLVGHLIESEPADRLSFANAAAGLYVSRLPAMPPTFAETLDFRNNSTAARW